ncbi:MAG: hypothetical protein EOM23_08300, partial [Candidatus Moranbacteria bacterium]|nr:hypothetical protein [Candidatus Moranbacteria bacterium]
MKKIQRFLTIDSVRINHEECGITDFKVILDRKNNEFNYYLSEDGEFDSTIYKIDQSFNSNVLKKLHPDFYRDNYDQLNDYDEKEK